VSNVFESTLLVIERHFYQIKIYIGIRILRVEMCYFVGWHSTSADFLMLDN